jgi:hypothetical protein
MDSPPQRVRCGHIINSEKLSSHLLW